ncbi:MAG TPA: helix-turn-helix domain-containing protein [Bacteroidia bacterium]|jgi:transcriptional regulator with XRE-family HTH domain|nr:helix-turn-helix domain-containing protein [Bacteroidia bacterium]
MRIHIGEKIKARAKELRMGPTELAQHISTSKQNVYGIYKRESIDTELLQKISKALELDFFCYYFDPKLPIAEEDLPKYFARNRQKADPAAEEVIQLRKELAELREKFDILKKLYELTTEKKPVKDYPSAKTAGKKKK